MVGTQWETRRPLLPELALLAATVAYGATFVLVQDALERRHTGRLHPVAVRGRRARAGAVRAALGVGVGRASTSDAALVRRGRVSSSASSAFVGYWFQNVGLERTTTSNSAFITGLFVVFTPLVETVVVRRRPPSNVLVAVAVATVGLFLLTGADLSLGTGDALTLGCAFLFGIWIFLGGRFSQRFDAVDAHRRADRGRCAASPSRWWRSSGLGHVDTQVIVAVLVTGVLCSAVAFTPPAVGPALSSSRAEPR